MDELTAPPLDACLTAVDIEVVGDIAAEDNNEAVAGSTEDCNILAASSFSFFSLRSSFFSFTDFKTNL